MTVLLVAAVGTLVGCGSDPPPPPDLVPQAAAAAIAERWSQEQMNHFKSDLPFRRPGRMRRKERSLEAGGSDGSQRQCLDDDISFDEKGTKIVTAISLQESGRGHEILLKGPYRIEVNGITDGSQPGTKQVAFRWDIDWDKAPDDLKACITQLFRIWTPKRFRLRRRRMALPPPFRWSAHLWRISGGRASTQCQDPQAGVDVGRSLLKIGNGASRVRNTTPAPGPRPRAPASEARPDGTKAIAGSRR